MIRKTYGFQEIGNILRGIQKTRILRGGKKMGKFIGNKRIWMISGLRRQQGGFAAGLVNNNSFAQEVIQVILHKSVDLPRPLASPENYD